MRFSSKQYAQALVESLESTAPKDQDLVLDNFVKILAENNDLRLFDEITSEFHRLELQRQGTKQVQLTTAHPLNAESEKQILNELNHLVKGKFEVKKIVDEKVLGGVLIQVEDQVLDATTKNNLEQLKNELTK